MKTKPKYTISTSVFDSLQEAEEKIQEWFDCGCLKEGIKVFEITEICYTPKIRLEMELAEFEMEYKKGKRTWKNTK